jgi:uncharacterized protein (DUF2384 family)
MAVLTPNAGVRAQSATTRDQMEMRFAAQVIAWARNDLELSYDEIGQMVNASGRTVMRWAGLETPPSRDNRDRLMKVAELRHLLGAVFREPNAAVEWLHGSVPALRGRTPLSSLLRGDLDGVVTVLASLESGAFL